MRPGLRRRTELTLDAATWTMPGERMKAGVEHRVPLSAQTLDVLGSARSLDEGSGLVFPSPLRKGQALSDMTLTKVLKVAGLHDRATVHGMRTSFKTWTMEQTDTPWAVGEAALAHQLGGSRRAGLCTIRPVRPPPGTHAAVGRLPGSQPNLSLRAHAGVFETGVSQCRAPTMARHRANAVTVRSQ